MQSRPDRSAGKLSSYVKQLTETGSTVRGEGGFPPLGTTYSSPETSQDLSCAFPSVCSFLRERLSILTVPSVMNGKGKEATQALASLLLVSSGLMDSGA